MNEQLPSPDFNSSQYERPNQNWICGKAKDGKACHLGPDAKGHCHATAECKPALKMKPGETKGRYYCTRTAQFGGRDHLHGLGDLLRVFHGADAPS